MKKYLLFFIIISFFYYSTIFADYQQIPDFPFVYEFNVSYSNMNGPGIVNIDDDPYLEIVVSSYNYTFAVNYMGELLWSANTPREAQPTMSFADVDNDGYLEILQVSRTGLIYILDRYGNDLDGWPKYYGSPAPFYSYMITTPVAYDLNGDGWKEIIWGDFSWNYPSYLYAVNLEGEHVEGFPFPVEPGISGTPAIGDVNNDGTVEIVCMGYYDLYVINTDGEVLDGWPQQPFNGEANFDLTSPALADLTGDGFLEIIVAASSNDFYTGIPSGLIVYKYDGTILDGWPQNADDVMYCPVTITDLDNDNSLDIICGRTDLSSTGNLLYVFHNDGQPFTGSPYYSFGDVRGPIIAGNIDSTPEKEIIFDSNLTQVSNTLGFIQGLTCYGDTIPGFPLRPKGCTKNNLGTLSDLNYDGNLDITIFSKEPTSYDTLWIHVYDLEVPYDPLQIEWKTYQYDFQRLGQYHPPFSFDPPINFNASVDSHGVNLTWEQPANERNYAYSIFRDDELLARSPYTSFCDSLVQSYTTYQYYIKSVYEQGFSPPSDIIEVTTDTISVDPEIQIAIKSSAYPNPFTNSTVLQFNKTTRLHSATPRQAENTEIKIYNVKGQLVREIPAFPNRGLGTRVAYEVVWDGRDKNGKKVGTGVYFYKLSNSYEHFGKVVKLK